MRKNNKYRNNNNNNNYNYNSQAYTLNYKFDSISVAGKVSGTALDLIKKYNELAKEAQGNANYVEAENFRQYAEHYRKIVTEINERKNQYSNNREKEAQTPAPSTEVATSEEQAPIAQENAEVVVTAAKNEPRKRTFKVIDISSTPDNTKTNSDADAGVVATVKKTSRPRVQKEKVETEPAAI